MLRLDRGCNVKLSTLEKHFFSPEERGGELLAVMQADLSAALRADGKPDLGCHSALLEKLGLVANSLRFRVKERGLPHLLNGLEIMEIAGIPPGPEVGRIKDALRDLHLAGELTTAEEAREWLVRR
jgi:poly(A) polymerase